MFSSREISSLIITAKSQNWLHDCVAMDGKGFILTGRDLEALGSDQATVIGSGTSSRGAQPAPARSYWALNRASQMLEAGLPANFAAGDVRANNVKRVASAVDEGAIAIHLVHRALAEI